MCWLCACQRPGVAASRPRLQARCRMAEPECQCVPHMYVCERSMWLRPNEALPSASGGRPLEEIRIQVGALARANHLQSQSCLDTRLQPQPDSRLGCHTL